MSTVPEMTPRHALGWPQGSVRALLAIMVVGLTCALMLIPHRDKPIPIPAYLLYLLFLILGHYFAARGHGRVEADGTTRHPLWLPRGCVRLLLLASLTGTCIYRYSTDPEGFDEQWIASVQSLQEVPLLPVAVLGGFFAGALLRMIVGHHSWNWLRDMEAWLSLIAVMLMGIATLIHLVINPSLSERLELPIWEGILAAVVAFYFGERS